MNDLKILYETQRGVNLEVLKRTKWEPTHQDFALAMFVEIFEFMNSLPNWKWWKYSQEINKERVLDELADIMAFYLSFVLVKAKEDKIYLERHSEAIFKNTGEFIEEFNGDIKNMIMFWFREIISGDSHPVKMINRAVSIGMTATDATQEEIINAYLAKSKENIERQRKNY